MSNEELIRKMEEELAEEERFGMEEMGACGE